MTGVKFSVPRARVYAGKVVTAAWFDMKVGQYQKTGPFAPPRYRGGL